MTGGKAVILGPTGRNFGAGMSGGIAYIYNKKEDFEKNCNKETYEIEDLIEEDLKDLKFLIQKHFDYTESTVAQNILSNWEKESERFVKVMPTDYKRVLNEIKSKKQINNG
jgi:glutamate synthase domain-containing protein 3